MISVFELEVYVKSQDGFEQRDTHVYYLNNKKKSVCEIKNITLDGKTQHYVSKVPAVRSIDGLVRKWNADYESFKQYFPVFELKLRRVGNL